MFGSAVVSTITGLTEATVASPSGPPPLRRPPSIPESAGCCVYAPYTIIRQAIAICSAEGCAQCMVLHGASGRQSESPVRVHEVFVHLCPWPFKVGCISS